VKEIRRKTRRRFSAEEKVRIVLEGLRGEESIATLCRREGIVTNLFYRWSKEFLEAGIEPSVGSVGDSYDNALAETIIGLYKTELIRRNGPWRNLEDVEFATLEWVDWFNNRRLFGPLGNIPPAEFEALYNGSQENPAMVAGLT
jgi:transposase InsO family protein